MIANINYKSVEIDITTYQKAERHTCVLNNMNENVTEKEFRKTNQNRFICSICLNKKASQEENRILECNKRISKSCPICQKSCETGESKNLHNSHRHNEDKGKEKLWKSEGKKGNGNMYIQTSQSDVTQGLTLLNEVLTVFQSKKQTDLKMENCTKTLILKDANVQTDIKKIPNLTLSRTFSYALGDNDQNYAHNGKFSVINCEPDACKLSQFSIDLIKHKSSSIPQMKLEELKNSLKEKTKSKDAIEEVNRMFATMRKHELRESLDDSNRPMIRNGPRVLPVVKTNYDVTHIRDQKQDIENCRNCQTSYRMSSGDFHMKHECDRQERYENYHLSSCRCKRIVCEHCLSNACRRS